MTKQDIVKQLQKNPQLAEKYDENYLKSVVEEQLFLRDYKKTFEKELNEDSITDNEEEEEIELEPEEIPIEEPQPEPEPEPQPEEEELPEPDLDAEPEEKEPEVLPVSKKGEVEVDPSTIPAPEKEVPVSKQDDTSEKEAEQDGYIRISPREAQELLSYKGKIFTAIFTKRSDGSLRALNGMTGVRKYTSGGELPYSPKDKGLIPVYDLKIGPGPKGYRTIPIEGLKALKINGRKYKIDQDLIKEIGNLEKTQYTQSEDEEINIKSFNFETDGKEVELKLSLNPLNFEDELNVIFGNETKPKNVGEIGFTVEENYDTIKLRNKRIQEKPSKEELEQKLQRLESNPVIKHGKRLGYRDISSYRNNRNLWVLVDQNFGIFRSYDNIKKQLLNYKEETQETPKLKEYINILNKVSYVAKDILNKYNLDLLIINKPSHLNNEITTKRNNIYTQLLKKYIPSGYEIKEKNKILYIQKQNLEENMKKDVLKQIVKEVLLEVKASKKVIKENKESTVLGKDLKVGQEFMAKLNHPIMKLEPNKPTQGRILVYLKDKPQPINMSMHGEYGILEKSLDENSPSPQRQSPDREVIEKPETDTPERKPKRRTLTPPTESPETKPKAEGVIKENEEELANKIASRFQKLKK